MTRNRKHLSVGHFGETTNKVMKLELNQSLSYDFNCFGYSNKSLSRPSCGSLQLSIKNDRS
jgi:hypothetical protein